MKKAVSIVAHPDDCVIFSRPFIHWFKNLDWTILYLTYKEFEPRAKEISNYWTKRQINVKFLGHIDNYRDMNSGLLSFDSVLANEQIKKEAQLYDLILTHNSDGEYGHIHHKFVHSCAENIDKPKVYFSSKQFSNYKCQINQNIDLTEIPLHKDVVSQFDNINCGYYFVTEEAKELVYGST